MTPSIARGALVRELRRDECLELLRSHCFGRVGATSHALPVVLPVNYRLVGEEIVFRTSPGTKLSLATAGAVIAFEVDDIDPVSHAGWSVLAVGRGRVITDRSELERLEAEAVPRWVAGEDERYISVSTAELTGREVGPA